MTSFSEIFMQYICPSLGTIMASAMFAAPIRSLREALSKGSLGDLNPTPWAFMTGNCLGWVSYAFVTQNMFVLASNLPGLILSIWLNIGAAKLQYLEQYQVVKEESAAQIVIVNSTQEQAQAQAQQLNIHDSTSLLPSSSSPSSLAPPESNSNDLNLMLPSATSHEHWIIQILTIWGITLSIVTFVPMSIDRKADIIGIVVNFNLVIFYGAPLGTIVHVLKTRTSSSIHRRTLATGLLNSFFWMVYGLALLDIIIFLPNFCGFVLSIVQMILCLIFPMKKRNAIDDEQPMSEQLVSGNNSESFVHVVEDDYDDREEDDRNLEML